MKSHIKQVMYCLIPFVALLVMLWVGHLAVSPKHNTQCPYCGERQLVKGLEDMVKNPRHTYMRRCSRCDLFFSIDKQGAHENGPPEPFAID